MIDTKKVEVSMNSFTMKHYNELGYYHKIGTIFKIKVDELPKGSHKIIEVQCDICGNKKMMEYRRYMDNTKHGLELYSCYGKCANIKRQSTNLKRYGVKNCFQSEDKKNKSKKTMLEKYGVEYSMKSKIIQNKTKKIMLEKYGVENIFQDIDVKNKIKEKTRKTKIKKGLINEDGSFDIFHNYKRKVTLLTKKLKLDLLNKWDGYDYYDGEYIKDNFDIYSPFHEKYPNFDHIISIREGFDKGLDINEVARVTNLCITKRKHNMSKYTKSEKDFKNSLIK